MDGGSAAEKTIDKITRQRMTKIAEIQADEDSSSKNRCNFKGEMISTVPEMDKVEIDTSNRRKSNSNTKRTLQNPEKLKNLESLYETLFGEGGFEILREHQTEQIHDPGKMGALSYQETQKMLQEFGLVEEDNITEYGSQVFTNWKGLEDYLSSEERIEDIRTDIGEMQMPNFLRLSGVNVKNTDSYLRSKDSFEQRWANQHNGTVELYSVTDALHSEENNGEALMLLEDVSKEDAENPGGYEEVGIRGIAPGEGSKGLNLDGEKIYGKVRADYLNFRSTS